MLMTVLSLVGTACGIVSVICFIILIIKMFGAGDPGMAILSLVLCLCGIGFLVAIVIGWVNVDKYKARQLMPIFTIAFILAVVLGGATYVNMPAPNVDIDARRTSEEIRFDVAA